METTTRNEQLERLRQIKLKRKEVAKKLKDKGLSNKEIADKMQLAESTVRILLQ